MNPTAVPHGFELVFHNLLHVVSDSIKTGDCGIASDPGTAMALCWEAGERKVQMCSRETSS